MEVEHPFEYIGAPFGSSFGSKITCEYIYVQSQKKDNQPSLLGSTQDRKDMSERSSSPVNVGKNKLNEQLKELGSIFK